MIVGSCCCFCSDSSRKGWLPFLLRWGIPLLARGCVIIVTARPTTSDSSSAAAVRDRGEAFRINNASRSANEALIVIFRITNANASAGGSRWTEAAKAEVNAVAALANDCPRVALRSGDSTTRRHSAASIAGAVAGDWGESAAGAVAGSSAAIAGAVCCTSTLPSCRCRRWEAVRSRVEVAVRQRRTPSSTASAAN